ncbi:Hypothetical predicted protein [Paramuricea clavata]|uniref:Uncharacterized protein n=1 Tax=Paramuricea clavata TaxID=317549 RepID=A0A6S7I8B9_PARCT|nr:Hypothetical predicted protein [Paramuricea clavata]
MDNLPSCEFTSGEVSQWLESNGFAEFSGKFLVEDVDGEAFSLLPEGSLETLVDKSRLKAKGYEDFTLKELINKLKKLRQKYKEEKDKSKQTGNAASKKWKFFYEIDIFLTQRHNVNPPVVVDTMASDELHVHEVDDKQPSESGDNSSSEDSYKSLESIRDWSQICSNGQIREVHSIKWVRSSLKVNVFVNSYESYEPFDS